MRKKIVSLMVVLVAAALGLHSWNSRVAAGGADGHRCRLEGTWTSTQDFDLISRVVAIPLDPSNTRFSMIVSIPNQDPTLTGSFPTITYLSDFVGEARRTGRNTFDVTLIAEAVNQDNLEFPFVSAFERVGTVVISGEIELPDCDTLQSRTFISIFSPDQDPFGDEAPLFGCIGPAYNVRERVTPMPPCMP